LQCDYEEFTHGRAYIFILCDILISYTNTFNS